MLLPQFLSVLKFSKVYKLRELKPCIFGNRLQYCVYLGFELDKELQTAVCTTFIVDTYRKSLSFLFLIKFLPPIFKNSDGVRL